MKSISPLLTLILVSACTGGGDPEASSDVWRVNTTSGSVTAEGAENAVFWRDIPYAQPPVGELRWEYPVAPAPQTAVYEANFDANGCAQTCALPPGNCPAFGISEDCLYLTVKAPAEPSSDPAGYPVMFWIHGGAYTQGLGNCALYNGTSFAEQGVITVVINYRLGAMGFMASKSQTGNYGMLDQRMALQWVQDNIKGFGGDPTRVTAAGQSAGAMSVATHLVSPQSKGLFSKAIMESNCLGMPYHTRESAGNNADAMAGYMKCDNDDIACLKSKTMAEVLDAQANAIKMDRKTLFINFLPFAPMVEEGGELPKQPLDAMAVGEFNPGKLLLCFISIISISSLSQSMLSEALKISNVLQPPLTTSLTSHITIIY